jgi:hypothetical protein
MDGTAYTGTHPYQLWGAATSPLDYYILHSDPNSVAPIGKQWWHIKYTYEGDDASIIRTPVTLDEVLVKARSDGGRVLLVYANETATSVQPIPLPPSLDEFVKKDNVSFTQDLCRREEEWPDYNPEDGTTINGNWMNDDHKGVNDWDEAPRYGGGYDDNYNWSSMSAKKFHEQDSGVSSTTLTPNTEVDEGVDMVEMQEVNGSIATWAGGGLSNASSDALGAGEPMEISDDTQIRDTQTRLTKPDTGDVEMGDADAGKADIVPKVEHIEMLEKKGG